MVLVSQLSPIFMVAGSRPSPLYTSSSAPHTRMRNFSPLCIFIIYRSSVQLCHTRRCTMTHQQHHAAHYSNIYLLYVVCIVSCIALCYMHRPWCAMYWPGVNLYEEEGQASSVPSSFFILLFLGLGSYLAYMQLVD